MPLTKTAALVAACLAAGITPRTSSGQTLLWTEASTLGYGVTAGSLALAACWSGCDLGTGGLFMLASGAAGLVVGNRIGASAEQAAREGRLTPGRRWAARFGTVTGFAAVGTMLAALWTNETGGNAPGEDERRLRDWTLLGATAGVVAQVIQERALEGRATLAGASPFVHRAPSGGLHLGLRISAPSW